MVWVAVEHANQQYGMQGRWFPRKRKVDSQNRFLSIWAMYKMVTKQKIHCKQYNVLMTDNQKLSI